MPAPLDSALMDRRAVIQTTFSFVQATASPNGNGAVQEHLRLAT
jgi:hypothetical protein